ncbi:uncharacterized protein BO80DRAFT_224788 [Aspergillus ibericus CBS 121593]|uniref:Ipa protein n=1 Tax=Aspergillus ibericus CBS 121593 TaxID=1448316 RepID=A0A395GQZ8_9EURO|nr:hypothetical protein BO80DRAFT_224788 [Aspergillus ibericus CBS 121593]RAK96493.1 hypothetical protein BO80DRAFT_224788 [Aspergillus ibericus CBS 121593]
MSEREEGPVLVRSLHEDLERKYREHGPKIRRIWHSYTKQKRVEIVKDGATGGIMLRHAGDRTLGNVRLILPEWNVRDLCEPKSDYFLHHLKHRATKSLVEQYETGVHGGPGDKEFILKSMEKHQLRYEKALKNSFTMFRAGDCYGQSYIVNDPANFDGVMDGLSDAVKEGFCVPHGTGELILMRQIYFLQALNLLVKNLLEEDARIVEEKAARAALAALSLGKPDKLSLEELAARALEQRSALVDSLHICRSEPTYLAHLMNVWTFSRPELVLDDKGRRVRQTDQYFSTAMFEAVHSSVVGAAVWDMISQILQALRDGPKDQAYKTILLQELANILLFEYKHLQTLFKRYTQAYSGSGHFKRIPDVYDDGIARVTLKSKPDAVARLEERVQHMFRLCQTDLTPPKAMDWIKKLDDLQKASPIERNSMAQPEFEAFGDLAMTTSFMQTLSASLPMPPPSQSSGVTYFWRLKGLSTKLEDLKATIDLSKHVIPIEKIGQPEKAEGALKALDGFIFFKMGADVGFLYDHLNRSCMTDLQNQYAEQKARSGQASQMSATLPAPGPSTRKAQLKPQQEKGPTTRRAQNSDFRIYPATESHDTISASVSPTFKLKLSTYNTFWTLFSHSGTGGSISWTAFEEAMADIDFSVSPTIGSFFTFSPPKEYPVQKTITLRRPQKLLIEGYGMSLVGRRLARKYGWGKKTFELA